jgi:hypothetical protein
VVTARRDDDNCRRFLADGVPRGDVGVAALVPEHGLAAGPLDHVRDPVPCTPRRVDPLEHEHPPRIGVGAEPVDARQRHALLDGGHPGPQAIDEQVGSGIDARGPAHVPDADHHVVERARVERHDLSPTAEPAEGLVDVAGRHGADARQVLGDDQVGLDLGDARLVEPLQRRLTRGRGAGRVIDLAKREVPGESARGDDRLQLRLGRVVALERASLQLVAQAEGVDDLVADGNSDTMRTGRAQPASYRTAARSARIGAMRSVITR